MASPLPTGLHKHLPTFSNIRNSIDLVLTKPLCDLWPRRCLTGFRQICEVPGQNKMKKCRGYFAHLQISLWKSSLSLKTPLLCLRPPFDKSWEKLNFKFDHFLCKCLSLWNWNTVTAALFCFLMVSSTLSSLLVEIFKFWYTIAYFNQHLLNICFMPASWYIYEANKNECITTYSPSFKEVSIQ